MFKIFLGKIASIIFSMISFFAPVRYVSVQNIPTPTPPSQIPIEQGTTTQKQTGFATTTIKSPVVIKIIPKSPILPPVPPTPLPQPDTSIDLATINTFARMAVVNILCTANGNTLNPISGTGIVISENGLILTNAHVAEYFLLQNYRQPNFIQCVIRTGSPAKATYKAELEYISPTWVENNKDIITEQNPKGTGENDFAFLHITGTVDGSSLPTLPYIPPNIREQINIGEPVVLVSYPAGFLGGVTISQNLNIASANTTVQKIETFMTNTLDVIDVGGTVVSQKGSSGGAVVDKYGTLIGLISTESESTETSDRGLYAITPAYINRTLKSELGLSLIQFLSQDPSNFSQKFQTGTAPLLTKILTTELDKVQ